MDAQQQQQQDASADARCVELDLTAAAWACAIRRRVKELADEMGRMEYVMGHPPRPCAAAMLFTALDRAALGRLMAAVEEAGRAADELLQADVPDGVPDLAAVCQSAAVAMGLARSEEG